MAASTAQREASPEEGAPEDEGPSLLSLRGARMPREPAGYQVQSRLLPAATGGLGCRGSWPWPRALPLFAVRELPAGRPGGSRRENPEVEWEVATGEGGTPSGAPAATPGTSASVKGMDGCVIQAKSKAIKVSKERRGTSRCGRSEGCWRPAARGGCLPACRLRTRLPAPPRSAPAPRSSGREHRGPPSPAPIAPSTKSTWTGVKRLPGALGGRWQSIGGDVE